jgi:PAS domain S-box-containing protein
VGAIESALALAVGVLIFRQGRALRRQVVMRERAQDSERTSQDELSRIMASVGGCSWSISVGSDGALERNYMPPEFEQLTGYPAEFFSVEGCNRRMSDEPWLRLIVPEDLQRVRASYERMASRPGFREICEYQITRADGEIIWICDNCVTTRHASGVIRYDGILTDISASKRAEDSERRSHDELSRILASVGECLWSSRTAPDSRIENDFISPAIQDICGYPPEQLRKPARVSSREGLNLEHEPWARLIVPEDHQRYMETYEKMFAGTIDRRVFEYRIVRSDGEIRWIRDNSVARRHPSGAIQYDGVLRDITEDKQAEENQRKLEERIRQTQKLESIGILAGGIAHDFNNLLLVILGNTDLAVSSAHVPGQVRENLQEIETAAQRASELCRELLVYSGRAPYVTAPIDLVDLVQEMENLLRLANSPGVRIETDFPKEIALIDGDAAQLRQLVMNLITNAVDSMTGDPGRIQISIEKRWCEEADLSSTFTHDSLPAGRYVVLSVSDNGCGMDEETLSRIFDPFFTTKFTGRGLGLAAALGIVRGHHGAISMTSKPGEGTRSLVYLPALMKKQVKPAAGTAKEAAWRTSGVVMHVDDTAAVRRVGSLMLERLGVKVVSVASGEEALRIMDSGDHDLRCVILDLMMPGLSGTDTLRAIRERNPSLPVLIATAYGESDTRELLGGLSATGLLAKPFTSKQLEEALRATLGE